MQRIDGLLVHSASDLSEYTECLHLTARERAVAFGYSTRPERDDKTAALLAKKGEAHEERYRERMELAYGERMTVFERCPLPTMAACKAAEARTLAAMESGAAVIAGATFFDGTFLAHVDFLRRVERSCARWPWSYEAVDTKLALSPKPIYLIALAHYNEHLERVSGTAPLEASIVLGSGVVRPFRIDDFAAYHRNLKASYLVAIASQTDAYPFECSHCDRCAWRQPCAARRDADDHLSLVANIRREQIRKLEDAAITTLGGLAEASDEACPKRLATPTFDDLRAQARQQHRYRVAHAADPAVRHTHAFRDAEPTEDDAKRGFARLPAPDAGDLFFDMEGDPMYRPDRGLEYLFGVYLPAENEYRAFWAHDPNEERAAFEAFVDFIVERQTRYPDLHVYHYAAYEITALKRLMGRFGSRERQIDTFLRAETFVDLFPVVRQSMWISQPSYSIKKVEALYGFVRNTTTRAGDDSIVMFESWLDDGDPATLEDIRAYNEDDCRSTFALRSWLLDLRAEHNTQRVADAKTPVAWRPVPSAEPPADDCEFDPLAETLLAGTIVPESLRELDRSGESQRVRWLLAHLLAYHRREAKPEWWEFFERVDRSEDLVDGDRKALAGLEWCREIPPYKLGAKDKNAVYTFRYPPQEHDVGSNPIDLATQKSAGEIVATDDLEGRVALKLASASDPDRLRALIPGKPLKTNAHRAALALIARGFLDGSLERDRPATLALAAARVPHVGGYRSGSRLQPADVTNAAVSQMIAALDGSYLVVQGPPGSGKSTIGAHVIVDLLAAGKRVALAAQSHKALHNLVQKVEVTARARGVSFCGCHKSSTTNAGSAYRSCVEPSMIADVQSSETYEDCALVSATTYAWAQETQRRPFDVVVIDEAGQIPLADALITSLVARNVVLLGDPQQLPHVAQGSHPLGTDRSILEHLLRGAATIPVERGIFLERSFRMHPDLAQFVSHAFYDDRLRADARTATNGVQSRGLCGSGLRYLPIADHGNARRSTPEAERIADEIETLLDGGTVTIGGAAPRRITSADILVVAPYNVQRLEIINHLRRRGFPHIAVGTVDKFQGQEAPIVFYSTGTSSAELAPRGLEFLLSPNRFNVAVSRAQALTVLVSSPFLRDAPPASIEVVRLVSLLCRYVEGAASESAPRLFAPQPLPPLTLFEFAAASR